MKTSDLPNAPHLFDHPPHPLTTMLGEVFDYAGEAMWLQSIVPEQDASGNLTHVRLTLSPVTPEMVSDWIEAAKT